MSVNHYTDKKGYHGIRATPDWRFKASQPPNPASHPFGANFTTLPPNTKNLTIRLRIPRTKTEYVFSFVDADDLAPLDGDRGEFIFYSSADYVVPQNRQKYDGKSDDA
jgi:hypothetical protein